MQFEFSTNIAAPAAKVFALYADVANWPQWDPDVKSVSLDGGFVSGATGIIVPNGGPKSKIFFTEVDNNRGFKAHCKLPLCTMRFEHELATEGSHTKATHRVVFEGLLAPVFGRLIGSGMRKTLPHALAGLKTAAEGGAQTAFGLASA